MDDGFQTQKSKPKPTKSVTEKESSTGSISSRAQRRLLRDLKELEQHPLLDAVARPQESNIFEWHGNLRAPSGVFGQTIFHIILTFPQNYPLSPPVLNICTKIPHRNILVAKGGRGYNLCLDMLETAAFGAGSPADVAGSTIQRVYVGWSSCYSVLSVLTQIQSFLLDESFLLEKNGNQVNGAKSEAANFVCKTCGHCKTAVEPPFPSVGEVKKGQVVITRPVLPHVAPVSSGVTTTTTTTATTTTTTTVATVTTTTTTAPVAQSSTAPKAATSAFKPTTLAKKGTAPAAQAPAPIPEETTGWTEVQYHKKKEQTFGAPQPAAHKVFAAEEPKKEALAVESDSEEEEEDEEALKPVVGGGALTKEQKKAIARAQRRTRARQAKREQKAKEEEQKEKERVEREQREKEEALKRKQEEKERKEREDRERKEREEALRKEKEEAARKEKERKEQELKEKKERELKERKEREEKERKAKEEAEAAAAAAAAAAAEAAAKKLAQQKAAQQPKPTMAQQQKPIQGQPKPLQGKKPQALVAKEQKAAQPTPLPAKPTPKSAEVTPQPVASAKEHQKPSEKPVPKKVEEPKAEMATPAPVSAAPTPVPAPKAKKVVPVVIDEPLPPPVKSEMFDIPLPFLVGETQAEVELRRKQKNAKKNKACKNKKQAPPQEKATNIKTEVKATEASTPVVAGTAAVSAPAPNFAAAIAAKAATPASKALPAAKPAALSPATPTVSLASKAPLVGSPISILPFDVLIRILSTLSPSDILSTSLVSKYYNSVAEDGYLWHHIFSQHHPHSHLTPSNFSDWKYIFKLEVSGIVDSLRCFHTKSSFEEDVLGIPIVYTVNPRTEMIDYLYSTMDVLSQEAYYQDKVRQTVWKESFTDWLPLYITAEHFERATPYLERAIPKLAPHWKSSKFHPNMILDVLPPLMNTMIVLLCDKGITASEKALNGLCALHRLFLACCKQYPLLQQAVNSKVMKFMNDEQARIKDECPNVGHLWMLLSVSTIPWRRVAPLILSESFDRNVIWICKTYPALAENTQPATTPDMDRLERSFKGSLVSLRLTMFNVYFLKQFRREARLSDICDAYDLMFGFPSNSDRRNLKKMINDLLAVTNWPGFYKLCGFKVPSPLDMTNLLKQSVKNSLKKRYHTKKTDFTRIQQSGVSKILLKGESFTCNTSIKRVYLEEIWGFPDGVIFLDASCLIYDFSNNSLGTVDFSSQTYGNDAIKHSGDVIDNAKKEGKHTISVSLDKLPSTIKSLYFTFTGYTTPLSAILHPYILFVDPDSNQELCQYQFDGKDTGTKTAVIMAKLTRESPSAQWSVVAIGHIGDGRAMNYKPIHDDITKKKL